MNILKMTACGFAVALSGALLSSSAMAGCGSGSIEVKYGGKETCVKPEQFATLSPAVQATADADDVAEAMGQDDDSSDDSASADDNGTDDSADDANDDNSNDSSDDNSGGSGSGGGSEGSDD